MSKAVVEAVKASLVANGVSLSGPCGAFEITKRVAYELRADGAGLHRKTGGNNCQGYSTDIVLFKAGGGADILVDGGGSNGPAWQWHADYDKAFWVAPVKDWADQVVDETKLPEQEEPSPDLQLLAGALYAHIAAVDDYKRTVESAVAEYKRTVELWMEVIGRGVDMLNAPGEHPEYESKVFGATVISRPRKG